MAHMAQDRTDSSIRCGFRYILGLGRRASEKDQPRNWGYMVPNSGYLGPNRG